MTLTTTGSSVCSAVTDTKTISVLLNTAYVDPSGTDAPGYGESTGSDAFATLTYALTQVCPSSSSTINVAAGTYTDKGITIADGTSNLSIVGAGIASTIFNGDNSDRFIHMATSGNSDNSSNTNNITISNMKITGYEKSGHGGAIKQEENILTNIAYTNIHFHDNVSDNSNKSGGAVMIEDGSAATFTGCTFELNVSDHNDGGAVYVAGTSSNNATVVFDKCIFKSNTANDEGGAIYLSYTASTITNCLFYENTSTTGEGGAIYLNYGTTTGFNCTVADNTGYSNGYGGGVFVNDGTHSFTNSIFYGNDSYGTTREDFNTASGTATLNYSICGDDAYGTTESNEVTGDPRTDATNDDYTLTDFLQQ